MEVVLIIVIGFLVTVLVTGFFWWLVKKGEYNKEIEELRDTIRDIEVRLDNIIKMEEG